MEREHIYEEDPDTCGFCGNAKDGPGYKISIDDNVSGEELFSTDICQDCLETFKGTLEEYGWLFDWE